MNTSASKGTETVNAQGAGETRVDTIDYRSSAGRGQEEKSVQVIHQPHSIGDFATSGGVLADAAAAVATTLQSAKEAVSGK